MILIRALTIVSMMIGFCSACGGFRGSSDAEAAGPQVSNQIGPAPLRSSPVAADLRFCVDETNRYRAMVAKAPLKRSIRLEAFAAEGARRDAAERVAHAHFTANRSRRIALAENEVPWWPFARDGSVVATMREGIARFWAEGPGGSHYRNLTGAYTQVGCGVFVNKGEITIVQDFR